MKNRIRHITRTTVKAKDCFYMWGRHRLQRNNYSSSAF